MGKVIIRPASREDIDAFSSIENKPTAKAYAADLDGKIIALGGLALFKGRYFAFCDLTPEARRYKVLLAKTARRLFAEARRNGVKFIYAEADTNEPHAIAWLHSLGFELDPRSQTLYRWSAN